MTLGSTNGKKRGSGIIRCIGVFVLWVADSSKNDQNQRKRHCDESISIID